MININKNGLIYTLFGSVRKIIAILLTIIFCCLCFKGKISTDQFIPIFSMVLGYYFGKSTALDNPGNLTNKKYAIIVVKKYITQEA